MTEKEEDNNNEELVLDDVVEVAQEDLSDEQKEFLNENVEDLTDEQKETYKDTLKEEDEDPEDVEPETRRETKKKDDGKKDDDDDVDLEDKKAIGRVVAEQLKKAGVGDAKDQLEVDSQIRENPELGKYRANALKYMKVHPNLTARDAMRIVSAEDQQKIGAQRERDAAKKAKDTQGGGTTARKPSGGGVDWSKATKEEMDAKRNEVLGRNV